MQTQYSDSLLNNQAENLNLGNGVADAGDFLTSEPFTVCSGEPTILVTFFADREAKTTDERRLTIAELVELIRTTTAPSKEQLPWLKLAAFGSVLSSGGSLRHDENVLFLSGCEADYDLEQHTFDAAVRALTEFDVESIVYTSPSHRPEAPRWRVLAPFDRAPRPADCHGQMMNRLNGVLAGVIGAESWTLSQSYYFGSVNNNPHHRVEYVPGQPIYWRSDLDDIAVGKPGFARGGAGGGGNGKRHSAEYWRALMQGVPQGGIPELGIKGRDAALASVAGLLVSQGVEGDRLMTELKQFNRLYCKPPLPDSDVRRVYRSIGRRTPR
jgi:Primase C terminal 1 (PriCT-1)